MRSTELDPRLVRWLDDFNRKVTQMLNEGYQPTPMAAREMLAAITRQWVPDGPAIPWVNDDVVRGDHAAVPVRLYHPAPDEARPVLLFLHGGGHMAGSVSVYDPISRRLAAATGHVVITPEYRLAPEHPYPAGLNDACTAALGVFALLEARQLPFTRHLAIVGDSAGAALAATVAARSQSDLNLQIQHQVLIYPCVDYSMSFPSMDAYGDGYFLTRTRIAWYFEQYFQSDQEDRYMASPLHRPIGPTMPATLIVSAGFDPLHDEACAYLHKLQAANIRCEHLHFPDMIHAFLNLEALVPEACEQTYRRIAAFLQSS